MLAYGRKLLSFLGPTNIFKPKLLNLNSAKFTKFKKLRVSVNFSTMSVSKKEFQRLSKNVSPINYNLWLKPTLEKFEFDGKEDVEVQVNTPTKNVVLNCLDIKISSATYCNNDGSILESSNISFNEPQETVTLQFPEELKAGKGVLSILFQGELNNKMKGFYRSKYTNATGEEKYAAVTQFEATDARRAFPCWDEPSLKATFDVTLVVPKDKVALSNMNVVSESEYFEDASLRVLKYAQTPIMSTYLLAFVVGEFDFVENTTENGVKVRVYTPLNKSEQGNFALDVAVKALTFYEEYFKIKYPLPKMDLIAIADFSAGAMENWGLVTYRETALLIDEKNSSAHSRQWVALVVCHELAHQWFGNLVTMEWWTHLWLNEGFASFMEYLATDHCHPKFDIWTQFLSHDFMRAVDLDALDNSHPIEVPVGHPDEIDEIFDIISYSKGASVIRMLHNWIGDETFKKGMHAYLSKWAYKNAFTEDLWASLGEASGKPVEKVMSTWTQQMGFPVLDVSLKARTDSTVTLSISQKKFQANQSKADDGKSYLWMIPISFSSSNSPDTPIKTILMEEPTTEVTLDVPKESWIKVNPGNYGFYRVRYSSELLNALLPAIKDKTLQPRDRLSLQNDVFALASSGVTSTTDFLNLMSAYADETNYTVWSDLNSNISALSNLLWQDESSHNLYKKFILKLTKNIHDALGWEPKPNESHLDSMLRSIIISRRGSYGCSDTLSQAKEKLGKHLEDKCCIPADLRASVYSTVLSHGDENDLEKLIQFHNKADLHEEKVRIERCIGAVSEPKMQQKVLEFAMSENVRSNDRVFVIGSVAMSTKSGRNEAWKFTKSNWDKLHEAYKGMFLMSRLVKNTTESFCSKDEANEIEEFFKKNPPSAAERTVQQSLENIRLKHDWWQRDGKAISDWLAKN